MKLTRPEMEFNVKGTGAVIAIATLVLSTTAVRAGNIHAEAGGPHQRERAEREWAREPKEVRDRVDREVREQAAARVETPAQSADTKTTDAVNATSVAAETAAERTLDGLTITTEDSMTSNEAGGAATQSATGDASKDLETRASSSVTVREENGKTIYRVESRNAAGEVVRSAEWEAGRYSPDSGIGGNELDTLNEAAEKDPAFGGKNSDASPNSNEQPALPPKKQ